jgi:hypothetical protein
MSDVQPESAPPAPGAPPEPTSPAPVAPTEPGPRPRTNALAVAALILAVLLSPLAALFGHIAAVQIGRSNGRERGAVIAWIAVGLGYLWLIAAIVAGVAVGQLLGR